MKRLNAFTLMELLVGMIVSSIVIGFGYGAWELSYRQFAEARKVKGNVMNMAALQNVIATDIYNCKKITEDENVIMMNGKKTISYLCSDSYLLRDCDGAVDTFYGTYERPLFVMIPDSAVGLKLVSSIFLPYKMNGQPDTMLFEKEYGADIVMNELKLTQP